LALVLLVHILTAFTGLALLSLSGAVLFRHLRRDALGLGGAKLFRAGGVWVGPWGLPSLLLLLATLSALLVAALVGQARRGDRVAFGAHLSLGILAVWLYGPINFWPYTCGPLPVTS
jgi:prepilin signal peptidase PulO-like enzyme (type II secretory pathway)